MFDVGFSELLVFGIIALLVLGPDKLPEAARFAAKYYSKFKRVISNVQNDIDRELRLSEFREQMNNEIKRIQEIEKNMQAQMDQLQQQKLIAETAAEPQLPVAPKIQYHVLTAEQTRALRAPLNDIASSLKLECPLQQINHEDKKYRSNTTVLSSTQPSVLNSETTSPSSIIKNLKIAV